jgi:hypothetical protein
MLTADEANCCYADAGSNPYWNSTFMFKIDRSCQEIGIKIYCHNTLAADDELAYTSLSFRKIFFEGHFVPLQSFNVLRPSGQVGGQIRMSLTFFSDTLVRASFCIKKPKRLWGKKLVAPF